MTPKVGIVVPTLGERPDYLEECLSSIRSAGQAHILLIAPSSLNTTSLTSSGLVDTVVIDLGEGLPAAINQGIYALPEAVEYVNWLGDDDLLASGSLDTTERALHENESTVMVFGDCEYIDGSGNSLWLNSSGAWAVPLLRFGPDLIPEPGALFRRSVFETIGGLETSLGWAFDFDLFIRLSKTGRVKYVNQTLAKFRWHPESLSVEHRKKSVAEASKVESLSPSFLS